MSSTYITNEDHQRQMLIEDLEAELSHWRLRSRSGERRFAERCHKVPSVTSNTGLKVERKRDPKAMRRNCSQKYHNQLVTGAEDHPKSVKAFASYPLRDLENKGGCPISENSSDGEDDSVSPSDSASNYTSPKYVSPSTYPYRYLDSAPDEKNSSSKSYPHRRHGRLLDGHPALQESPMKSEKSARTNNWTQSSGWITLPRSCILHGPDSPYECEECGCK